MSISPKEKQAEKPLEKTRQIQCTTDYSVFKKTPTNRGISPGHLLNLMESIKKKNLLPSNPIQVNKKMEVIEGQHRLEAAKRLGIPIHFIVEEDLTDADIILMNTNRRNWKIADYCRFYMQQNKKGYAQIMDLHETYGVALNILVNMGVATRCPGGKYTVFKEGNYVFPEEKELEKIIDVLKHKVSITDELCDLAIPFSTKRLIKSDTFIRALLAFMCLEEVDPKTLAQKLKLKAESIKPCASQHNYHIMLKEIYNFRNNNPID